MHAAPWYRRSQEASRVAVVLGLLAVLVLTGCGRGESGSAGGEGGAETATARSKAKGKAKGAWGGRGPGGGRAAEPAVPVIVAPVTTDDMQAFLDGSATFEAEDAVEVVSQATGVVAQLHAEEGDRVRRGQVLAQLDYEDLELAEARARSEFDRLTAEFERARRLSAESFLSEEEFQRIEFDLRRVEIDWKTARLNLDRTRILAPIGGTVVARAISVGQLVRENDTVYEVVDFASLIAPVFVPEKYLPELHVGQEAIVATRGAGGNPVRGRVLRIAPTVDSQSGTVRVVVELPDDPRLRPGMFADVQLVPDAHEDVVVVPKKALVYDDERPHAFIVENGAAHRRALSLGYQDSERAEVTAGLDAGDLVVLVGQSTLKDGSVVAPEDESGNPVDTGAPAPDGDAVAGPGAGSGDPADRPGGRGQGPRGRVAGS
jgi:RND family efflux transporter MFP subunit